MSVNKKQYISKAWLFSIIAFLISATVILIIGEVVYRLASPKQIDSRPKDEPKESLCVVDDLLGWRNAPNANVGHKSLEFDVEYKINSHGIRASLEYSYVRVPNKNRIVVIGDSFTFGHGVNNEHPYSAQLEKSFLETEVINLGTSGTGTDQQLLLLKEEGIKYNPDLVILGFYKGDVFRNIDLYHGKLAKPTYKLMNGRLVLTNVLISKIKDSGRNYSLFHKIASNSKLYGRISSRGIWLLQHLGYGNSWKITDAILREIKKSVLNAKANYLVLVIPSQNAIYGSSLLKRIHLRTIDKMNELLIQNKIEYLDATPILSVYAKKHPDEKLYYDVDAHFTPTGHKVIAEAIKHFLIEKGWK